MLQFSASPSSLRPKRSLFDAGTSCGSLCLASELLHRKRPEPIPEEFKESMVRELERRLGGDTKKARALESLLFRQTPLTYLQEHFKDPSDALNYSLRQVALSIIGRITRKEELQHSRSYRLELELGADRYHEVMALVRKVKLLRLARAGAACHGPRCASLTPALRSNRNQSLPLVIPSPVNQLFFHNALVEIVDLAPVTSLHEQDWDGLVRQAKQDLQEYLEWSEAQGPTLAPDFEQPSEPAGLTANTFCPPTKRPRRISNASGDCK